jgi:lipoyl synthase
VRWLGTVTYGDALALQRRLWAGTDRHLLLLEHPPVYTLGVRTDPANLRASIEHSGAEVVRADRGGDVTYHGPGQLVGYPVMAVPGRRGGGMADTAAWVHSVEQVLLDALAALGVASAGRVAGYPGIWLDPDSSAPRKVAAVGVRLGRGRSMHGFALNVAPELGAYDHIVACGIPDRAVTSLAAEGLQVAMPEVVDAVAAAAARHWGHGVFPERQELAWRVRRDDLSAFSRREVVAPESARREAVAGDTGEVPVRLRGRLADAGVTGGLPVGARKPEWLRAPLRLDDGYRSTHHTLDDLGLVTVCEEAGCPNRSECWNEGTATFMLNGDRCTRACGFCLVDTRRPLAPDADEPERVAEAVARMDLEFVVLTTVARDDLADGGAGMFARTTEAIRARRPGTSVEVLISDLQGDPASLEVVFDARPEVCNHNLETVLRLQSVVRPSASYGRSLSVLARAADAGLVTKSGLMVGLGETPEELHGALADLAAVGVDIVTIGQYLRPSRAHLPVVRWWHPDEFDSLAAEGERLGIARVVASPFTRSSHHAAEAYAAARASRGLVGAVR